jgi:hypothetical protein
MPSGVVVAMATHNSARFIQRSLASIDKALKGRPYALVVADDASTDDTVRTVRQFPMRAQERVIVTLPKAPGVGESKNRAVKLAAAFLHKYPWVAFMDDDDEMLPGRFTVLLENMEAEGQKAGIGDWVHFAQGGVPTTISGDWSLHSRMFSPCKTVIHRDIIPQHGNYFAAVPRDVHEDMVTHHRVALSGTPWCYHGGDPAHVYHQRNDSYTQGPEHSTRMLENTERLMQSAYPESRTTIASFCTVAIGPSVAEAEILVKSLRLSKNDQPVLVLTDDVGAATVASWGVAGVETMLCDPASYASHFVDFATVFPNSSLTPGPFLGKMDVITEAATRHGTTLYLDADMVVLRRFLDVISAPIGLAPELSRSCMDKSQSSWGTEQYGHFNGGYVYASKDGLHIIDWWRREFLKSWRWHGSDNRAHGGFTDQSALDLAPLFGCVHIFHPGHNFMYMRVPRPCPLITTPDLAKQHLKVQVGFGLFHRGWPVVTVHAHFRCPTWAKESTKILRQVIGLSKAPHHADIYGLIVERT